MFRVTLYNVPKSGANPKIENNTLKYQTETSVGVEYETTINLPKLDHGLRWSIKGGNDKEVVLITEGKEKPTENNLKSSIEVVNKLLNGIKEVL